ncbi:ParA family protein [Ruegeria sp. HKCCD6119]|uniref:ParA family protein n=1 Tax=Ruegeria sp. HKCCD6119 TaxID=2683003 RepID=UPI00149233E5|nr:ParA family protein [Ruegeria sp. HKCCD6119]NOD86592.1 AAA family ATPase [Ruegeria sp. HKCCD6119]
MNISIFSFYNNKGGVGKTTLCQNVACLYAEANPDEQVVVIDLCPQSNISQFLLGGGHKGYIANQRLQSQASRRNIVGFMDWLVSGNSGFTSTPSSYLVQVSRHNPIISNNLHLLAGDTFLESLTLALNFATMNPANVNAWSEFVTAIRRLCELELQRSDYSSMKVFIDCNPSFSIYTQMALVSSDFLVVPVMADYSSIEGIKGILMLLYGKYPSAAVRNYARNVLTFSNQIQNNNLRLPTIFEIPFNSYTSNLGAATAYNAVRNEIIDFGWQQYQADSTIFAPTGSAPITRKEWQSLYFSDVKDFHTSGKVSASLGIPLHRLPDQSNYIMPDGTPVSVPRGNYQEALQHVQDLVSKI